MTQHILRCFFIRIACPLSYQHVCVSIIMKYCLDIYVVLTFTCFDHCDHFQLSMWNI
jgi:hypothetical protein